MLSIRNISECGDDMVVWAYVSYLFRLFSGEWTKRSISIFVCTDIKKRTANWKVDHNHKMDFKYNTQTVYFLITNETEPITATTTTTKKKAHTNSGKKMSKKCVGSGPLVLTLCMTFLRSCWIPNWVLTPLKFKWSLSLRAHVNSK